MARPKRLPERMLQVPSVGARQLRCPLFAPNFFDPMYLITTMGRNTIIAALRRDWVLPHGAEARADRTMRRVDKRSLQSIFSSDTASVWIGEMIMSADTAQLAWLNRYAEYWDRQKVVRLISNGSVINVVRRIRAYGDTGLIECYGDLLTAKYSVIRRSNALRAIDLATIRDLIRISGYVPFVWAPTLRRICRTIICDLRVDISKNYSDNDSDDNDNLTRLRIIMSMRMVRSRIRRACQRDALVYNMLYPTLPGKPHVRDVRR
jgi:hypothetical protein